MDQLIASVRALIVGLFDVVMRTLAMVEGAVRSALSQAGVSGDAQTAVLVLAAIMVVILAFRLLARVFALLTALFLVLLLLQALAPDGGHERFGAAGARGRANEGVHGSLGP